MLKAIVIDDDPISRKILANLISKSNKVECIKEYDNAVSALEEIESIDCDLIFLDIEMPEMNGLEFISAVPGDQHIIVISSKSEYAAETYNYEVTDYMVKPVDKSRFDQALNKVEEMNSSYSKKSDESDHMFIKKNKGYSRVNYEDITFVEALADYVQVNTTKERFTVLSTMKSISQRLPSDKFLRIHRSYIVQIDKIERIDENMVSIGEKTVPVSRSYKESLMKHLNLL